MGYFYEYNKKYFGGIMPLPGFELLHTYCTLGFFSCQFDCYGNVCDPIIKMTDVYDYLPNQFTDILMHEMIHYYLAYTHQDLQGSHEGAFLLLAAKFNIKYNMNITPQVDIGEYRVGPKGSKIIYNIAKWF